VPQSSFTFGTGKEKENSRKSRVDKVAASILELCAVLETIDCAAQFMFRLFIFTREKKSKFEKYSLFLLRPYSGVGCIQNDRWKYAISIIFNLPRYVPFRYIKAQLENKEFPRN
jgi:hypothetical protein